MIILVEVYVIITNVKIYGKKYDNISRSLNISIQRFHLYYVIITNVVIIYIITLVI